MIYVTTSSKPQQIYVPRNGYAVSGTPVLTVRSTSTLAQLDVPVTTATVQGDFVCIIFTAPAGLIPGEWEYTLTNGSMPVREYATGLLMVVSAGGSPTEYNESIEYKQYGE